jgi:hypothetical protein
MYRISQFVGYGLLRIHEVQGSFPTQTPSILIMVLGGIPQFLNADAGIYILIGHDLLIPVYHPYLSAHAVEKVSKNNLNKH